MRIEYKEQIATKLAKLYHELQIVNRLHTVEAVYLTCSEWDELRNSFGYSIYPKRVAIHQPLRIEFNPNSMSYNRGPDVIITEEIEYHGFKIRKEYK